MSCLADHAHREKPVGLKEISKKLGISLRYLEQLVVPLKNAALLKSVAGKYGGYLLTREPGQIKVGEIVEVAMGPISLINCLENNYECKYLDVCITRRMWGLVNSNITDILYDYSLQDLSEKKMVEKYSADSTDVEDSSDEDILAKLPC